MLVVINIFLIVLGIYAAIGFIFGVYFLIKGATKIDSNTRCKQMENTLLLFPGVFATWPFLLAKIITSKNSILMNYQLRKIHKYSCYLS